ncbi:hypothetical protein [Thermogutta sp.]|uniref:hypothetical protein n=1 Tax=Thermogutta sp. TaxID=1962930 RepID=UPI0032209247
MHCGKSGAIGKWAVLFFLGCALHRAAWGQPVPYAAKIFPQDTAAFVSIPNIANAKTAFLQSAVGRMVSDPELRPFVADVWAALVKGSEEFEKQTGVSLEALLAIPQGEVSVGFVSSSTQNWVLLVYLDSGQNAETVSKLVDFVCHRTATDGGKVRVEQVEDVTFRAITPPREEKAVLGVALDGSRFIGGIAFSGESDLQVIRDVIRRAKGSAAGSATLAEQKKFQQFLSNIRYAKQGQIHGLVFADPLQILEGLKTMNPGAAVTLAILPVLGLDGLNSIGAAMSLDVAGWDSIRELHIFLDNPRRGVLDIPAFKKGDGTPEFFIPDSVMQYVTVYVDLPVTVERISKIYDGFRGEGAFQRQVLDQINRRLQLDVVQDILPATTGRITLAQWIERPIRLNSVVGGFVLEMKDEENAAKLVETIAQSSGQALEKKEFGQRSYYISTRNRPESFPEGMRYPIPCLAAIGPYVVSTDSPAFMEQMLITADSPEKSLTDSLEYKLVRGRIKALAGTESPSLFTFSRPESTIEMWYEAYLSNDSPVLRAIEIDAPKESVGTAIIQAIKGGKLPPVDVLKRYFAPQGGLLIDDATGLHLVFFALRKKLP